MYCVILGDIVDSRNINDEVRNKIKRTVTNTFEQLNNVYSDKIMAPFGLVRGDAFEGWTRRQNQV